MQRYWIHPVAFIVWGPILVWFGTSEIAARAMLEVVGIVIASDTLCEQPGNIHCVTTYKVLADGASDPAVYVAESNDHSLAQQLPIGIRINKTKGSLAYIIDGNVVDDFPLFFYLAVTILGIALIVIGLGRLVFTWRRHA